MFRNEYDVIVVGAGHAGAEAAAAAANMGASTLLITMNLQHIAQMSCNPAVGGIAKGQIVREIDALGGYMGIITDKTAIQFKMLNQSKGPAMWSPRAQSDRMRFSEAWRLQLEALPTLDLFQGVVNDLLIEKDKVVGVRTSLGIAIKAKSVVLTNGTFLNGVMHIGLKQFGGGRAGEPAAHGITECLVQHGFEAGRMKTGTPPFVQEPFNEVIGSRILACMSVPYTAYTLAEDDQRFYSKCSNFIDEDHEYVSAYYLCKSMPPKEGMEKEEQLRQAMEHHQIRDGEVFIQQMLCLDFIIMNVDRHWGNFGFIRNVNTLEVERPAPIFDNGNSLWYDMAHIPEHFDQAKTFRKKHRTQIKLVKDFSGIDFAALKRVPAQAQEILRANPNLPGDRAEKIAQRMQERIQMLARISDRQGNILAR